MTAAEKLKAIREIMIKMSEQHRVFAMFASDEITKAKFRSSLEVDRMVIDLIDNPKYFSALYETYCEEEKKNVQKSVGFDPAILDGKRR